MQRTWFALPLLLALANCTGAQRTPDKPTSLDAGLYVRVLRGAGGTTELKPGETLLLTDRVELELSVAAPAYVYVVLYAAAGESTMLFPQLAPEQAAQPLRPGERKRVTFEHPEQTFAEPALDVRLLAVSSPEPLGPALCTLLRLRCPGSVQPNRGSGPTKDPPPPPPPPPSPQKTADRRPPQPGQEKRQPGCTALVFAAASGTHAAALVFPVVLNYQTAAPP